MATKKINVELIESPLGLFNHQGKTYIVKSGNYQAYLKAKRNPSKFTVNLTVLGGMA